MFNNKKNPSIFDSGNSNSLFGKGTRIQGVITGDGDIRIDGNLIGDIEISGKLIVGESAIIKGQIKADRAEIYGRTVGKIHVKGILSIKGTGIVEGEILVGQLQVEQLAIFNGVCHMVLPGHLVDIKKDQVGQSDNRSAFSIAQ